MTMVLVRTPPRHTYAVEQHDRRELGGAREDGAHAVGPQHGTAARGVVAGIRAPPSALLRHNGGARPTACTARPTYLPTKSTGATASSSAAPSLSAAATTLSAAAAAAAAVPGHGGATTDTTGCSRTPYGPTLPMRICGTIRLVGWSAIHSWRDVRYRPMGRRMGVPGSRRPRGVADGAPGVAILVLAHAHTDVST
jgi:hypothetical protein